MQLVVILFYSSLTRCVGLLHFVDEETKGVVVLCSQTFSSDPGN